MAPTRRLSSSLLALTLCACATATARPPAAPELAALVAAQDRTLADRARDPARRPAELLAFLEVRPGMRVAELGAADGYTAELLARAVGPAGTVWAQNPRAMVAMIGADWPRRLERPAMARVVRVDREFDDPLPPEARGLDRVVLYATYHDTVWLRVDRARMTRAIFEALAPGGALVVVDHSARPGGGDDAAYDLHRMEESRVVAEVTAAGLRLAATADFSRNPSDTRDWSAAPNEAGARAGMSDRFALRFVKP